MWEGFDERYGSYVKTTLLAGAILLENGAEIKRVEDTMQRIATNAGYPDAQVFVLLTGITVSLPENATSEVRAIHNRGMDLEKWIRSTACHGSLLITILI